MPEYEDNKKTEETGDQDQMYFLTDEEERENCAVKKTWNQLMEVKELTRHTR